MADWSLLPRDLLERIVDRFETSYQIVHFRSVCSSWRSIVPPLGNSRCLGIKTCIPLFAGEVKGLPKFEGGEYCTLRKIPIFLLRFQTPFGSDYLLAEMHERKSGKPMLMSSPLSGYRIVHRTLLANTAPSDGTGQTLLNTLTSQIIPLGHYYKINYYEMTSFSLRFGVEIEWGKTSRRVQFIELDSEDCRDFVVLARIESILMMFRSRTMSWTQNIGHPKSYGSYQDMVAFKGNFYVVDSSGCGQVFVIEPSLEVTEITSLSAPYESSKESLVQSGEDLLLVQRFTPGKCHDEHMYTWFRVFRLDGEGRRGKWVRVYDLKDRVIFLGSRWNLCLSIQNLPGAKENCIVFIKSVKGMFEGHISGHDSLLVFDLRTRRTSTAFTECRGYMGAFGKNLETLVSCGLVTMPNPRTSIY